MYPSQGGPRQTYPQPCFLDQPVHTPATVAYTCQASAWCSHCGCALEGPSTLSIFLHSTAGTRAVKGTQNTGPEKGTV